MALGLDGCSSDFHQSGMDGGEGRSSWVEFQGDLVPVVEELCDFAVDLIMIRYLPLRGAVECVKVAVAGWLCCK